MALVEIAEKILGLTANKDYIFPRCADGEYQYVAAGRSQALFNNLALTNWFEDIRHGRRNTGEIIENYFGRKPLENIFQYFNEAILTIGRLYQGGLMANGFRVGLLVDNRSSSKVSDFGIFLHQAYNDSSAPHGHEHGRRKERFGKKGILRIRELRHGEKAIETWLPSFELDNYWHDVDQMLFEHWNNLYPNQKVAAKAGHEEMAQFMLWVLRRRYQFESQISRHDAEKIIAGELFMGLDHGEPENWFQRLEATGDAGQYDFNPRLYLNLLKEKGLNIIEEMKPGGKLESIGNLVKEFQAGQIDLRTLKIRQIYALGLYKRLNMGFKMPDSAYGLLPLFEQEYSNQIEEALQENRTLGELLKLDGENEWEALCRAKELSIQTDIYDMKSHYFYSLLRTWTVGVAANRPWWRPEQNDEIHDLIMNGGGNVPSEKDSDVRRMLWETINEKIKKTTIIGKSDFNQKIETETGILKMLAIKTIGRSLMAGDLSRISAIYRQRRSEVTFKTLMTVGYDSLSIPILVILGKFLEKSGGIGSMTQFIGDLMSAKGFNPSRYKLKLDSLQTEERTIAENFAKKPDGVQGIKIYTQQDIVNFTALLDKCIKQFCQTRKISPAELLKYKAIVKIGLRPETMPFKFFDSLGGNIKTWMEPNPIAKEKLKQIIFGIN